MTDIQRKRFVLTQEIIIDAPTATMPSVEELEAHIFFTVRPPLRNGWKSVGIHNRRTLEEFKAGEAPQEIHQLLIQLRSAERRLQRAKEALG